MVNFADTGLPLAEKQGEEYMWIRQGAKGGRPLFVPMNIRGAGWPSPVRSRSPTGTAMPTPATPAAT
jgi:hypothetical protein